MLEHKERELLAERLKEPLRIGGKAISSRLLLAPLAGLNHQAMRELIGADGGAGLLYTGMLSAKAVPTENPKKSDAFSWNEEELPILVGQIFGNEPEDMAVAAKRIEKEGFFGVDINMGCSVAAIVKKGAGAGLLRDRDRARRMVGAVREAVSFPVLVKLRTGWQDDPRALENTIRLVQEMESDGIDAITFHPRQAPDRRTRPPVAADIREIKRAVKIPVFGNGNVCTAGDVLKMLEETGCDGVAIGRMAIARPWIFESLLRGEDEFDGAADKVARAATGLLNRMHELWEPGVARKLYKKYVLYLCSNFASGSRVYGKLTKGGSHEELLDALQAELGGANSLTRRPNMLLFSM